MADYDLIARMNSCFNELELALHDLGNFLNQLELLQARVFALPEIAKGEEHNPADKIQVTPFTGEAAQQLALQHFQRLFIHHNNENVSSKSAVRLPGVLCYAVDEAEHQSALLLIEEVNKLKAELENIVTVESGLAREQRFEFVHTHLRGLITLNAYRSVNFLNDPDSVRFGWANKHIIKNVTRDEVLAQLEKSLNAGRAVSPYTREQWMENINREMNDVKRLPEHAALKFKRPVKVQPIARVWYRNSQKQVQHPCPLPLIALCLRTPVMQVPKLGELQDYDASSVTHKYKPKSQPLSLLIKRLHLYTDYPL
ncbi:DNA replication terminus site-binding protein [Rahnella sp. Lac-M11]|uniref:DNA replication terminus site-binding protein n=1 Tax=Rahnella contaminans TaxID=2703882 RepID=A0A6M2B189_9GAMM|nr:DNA replication terminus site-binding protein [Rahnella contaminans]NGX86124.1 DNA replication terminus site-binding protein [Rahnella contaminans]